MKLNKKGTYIDSVRNLQFLSKNVFSLQERKGFQKILNILLEKEQPEKGDNLTCISRTLHKEDKKFTRKIITKILRGSTRIEGLIPLEYLYEKKENKHRWGKEETSFHLRFKGMLAALSLGYSLDKIYLYQEYIGYLENFVKDKKLVMLIEKFFQSETHLFLLYHYVYKIDLTKSINFVDYYLSYSDMAKELLKKEEKKKTKKIFIKIIKSYVTTRKILEFLGLERITLARIPFYVPLDEYTNEPIIIDDSDLSSTPFVVEPRKHEYHPYQLFISKKLKKGLGALVYEWPRMMEKYNLEKDNFSINKMLPKFTGNYPSVEKEFEPVDNHEIEKQLQKFGIKIK